MAAFFNDLENNRFGAARVADGNQPVRQLVDRMVAESVGATGNPSAQPPADLPN